ERQASRISRIRFGDKRAEYVADLRFRDAVSAAQLERWPVGLGGQSIEVMRLDRQSYVSEITIEAHGHEVAGGADPRRAAPQHYASEGSVGSFDFHGKRSLIEIHRDVVVQPGDIVDGGDVVGAGLEPEPGPVEGLSGDDRRGIAAKINAIEH